MMNLKAAIDLFNTKINLQDYELAVVYLLLNNGAEGSVPNAKIYQALGRDVLEQRTDAMKHKVAQQKLEDLLINPLHIETPSSITSFGFLQSYMLRVGPKKDFNYRISPIFLRMLHAVAGPLEGLYVTCQATSTSVH